MLLVAASAQRDTIELDAEPSAGAAWRIHVEHGLTLQLDEVVHGSRRDGRDSEVARVRADTARSAQRTVSWIDSEVLVESSELRRLRRVYGEIAHTERERWTASSRWDRQIDGSASDAERAPLSGKTILFDWDERRGELRAESAPFDYVDPVQLDALQADTRLSVLLPGRAISVGDAWYASAEVLDELLVLGGPILEPAKPGLFDELLGSRGELDGEMRFVLAEVDEAAIARVSFEGQLHGTTTKTITALEACLGYVFEGEGSRSDALTLDFDGEFTWDIAAHRWRNVRCGARIALEVEERMPADDSKWQLISVGHYRGELSIAANCER